MPVNVPQEMLNDYLMSRSVMDAPRTWPQWLTDFVFGRTLPQQATNAFTGGVGTIRPQSQFMPYMKGALDLLPIRLRKLIEDSPQVIEVIAPNTAEQKLRRAPANFWSLPGGGGQVVVDTKRIFDPDWFGMLLKDRPQTTEGQIIEAVIGHELGHGANKLAFNNPGAVFPGANFFEKELFEPDRIKMLREVLPVLIDQDRLRPTIQHGYSYIAPNNVKINDLWEALKSLESFYPTPSTPMFRQVNRHLMRRTAE